MLKQTIDFTINNWATIATILFGISELLSLNPKVKSNGLFQLVYNTLKK